MKKDISEKAEKEEIKGLELSRAFYEEYGRAALMNLSEDRGVLFAVGLCGHGSECSGYDDSISKDHDFDPGFCIWLGEKDYESSGFAFYRAYEKLPEEYRGFKRRRSDFFGRGRRGVFSIPEFYRGLTGIKGAPECITDWFRIPEYALCEAVNGEVFEDLSGEFSEIREKLRAGYPPDVRLKKIAAEAALMAQSGQYNYERCLKHGEKEAARLAINEFVNHAAAMVFLLNKRYMPYYKWRFRALRELPLMGTETADKLSELLIPGKGEQGPEQIENIIEYICSLVANELRAQGLSDSRDDYLEPHAFSVMEHIDDENIRAMHVMAGVM